MANILADARIELEVGVRALGLSLDKAQVDRLLTYQGLPVKQNHVYNLTAIRDAGDMLTHHLLDSLSTMSRIAELVCYAQPDAPHVSGVSSGDSLPGIPLATAFPDAGIMIVDTVQKKTVFLTWCHAELGLANIQSHWGHAEKLADATGYNVITPHAFTGLVDFANLVGHLLAPGGRMVVMKDMRSDAEVKCLPTGWTVEVIECLTIPELSAERRLAILVPSA